MDALTEQLLQQAIVEHQAGNFEDARQIYLLVLDRENTFPLVWSNLGALCLEQGDLERAEICLNIALELAPEYTNALHNQGMLKERRGQREAAEAAYIRVLELSPQHSRARNNLAGLLMARGELEEAEALYRQANADSPSDPEILTNLACCLKSTGKLDEAIAAARQALNRDARSADRWVLLGTVLQALNEFQGATACYEKALERWREHAGALNNLGVIALERGDVSAGRDYFSRVMAGEPDNLEALLNDALSLPILYDSEEEILANRGHFEAGIRTLHARLDARPEDRPMLLNRLATRSLFYLQYQGRDDRELQTQWGKLLSRLVAPLMWSPEELRASWAGRAVAPRIRVGYISAFFREHTVGRLMLGFVQARDRARFEAQCFMLGASSQPLTETYRQEADRFTFLPLHFEAALRRLREAQLDVAIFSDIGMTPLAGALAAARVAPIQAVFWGHPVTSGIASVDFFLSSALMEPASAQTSYTEHLIELPGIGVCYPRPMLPEQLRRREAFGLPEDAFLYLSCQSLYKYLPRYDDLFPRIALAVPEACFVFLSHPRAPELTRRFEARLERAFERYNLRAHSYVHVLPHLSHEAYLEINACADGFLDTPSWSGGNTTLEALACQLPVIAYAGQLMRSRHAAAMLTALELDEAIAYDEETFVALAVRLARDQDWRLSLRRRIAERAEGRIFGDRRCVRALEAFLVKEVEQ